MEITETAVAEFKSPTSSLVEQAKSLTIRTFEQAMDAADLLLDVKQLGEQITARKEEITKPLNDSLKSTRKLFKPLEEQCAEAETAVKEAVLSFHERHWKRGKDTDNTINGLRGKVTLVAREQINITDPSLIPPQFCSPDASKIEHALKAGIAVAGAELIKTYGVAAGKN